jgi:uncharacterized protein (TIGR02588 family)
VSGRRPEAASESPREERISRWEWVAGAIGLVLVLVALVVLVREALAPASPPDLSVRTDSVRAGRDVYVVHFTVANDGRSPAMEVEVEGRLVDGADTLTAAASIRYVPGNSRRGGGLLFPVDPASRQLHVRAVGYEEP